jgi:hypothetical protein
LLDREPAPIARSLAVIDRNREIIEEGKHLVLLQEESLSGVGRAGRALGIV